MQRLHRVIVAILVLLSASRLDAQETILGLLETPASGNAATGALVLSGWALADSGIRRAVVFVDGVEDGPALLGRVRPDIEALYPGFPDSTAAGFSYRLSSNRYLNGLHTISVEVVTNDGQEATLDGAQQLFFNNNETLLKPFGAITAPVRNAQVVGSCDLTESHRRLIAIEGWGLDLGVELNDAGVGWVELSIDGGRPIFNTRTGCRFLPDHGGFSNCFGLLSPAVESLYPFARDAANAGFRFVLDIGFLISGLGYEEVQHILMIRAGDVSNQVGDIGAIPVTFRCRENLANEQAFGAIERPRAGSHHDGRVRVQGWILDGEGVDRVEIYVDDEPVGEAAYGAAGGVFETRPAVIGAYPGFPDVQAPVFRLVGGLDTAPLQGGEHRLQVSSLDRQGDRTLIGEVTFHVDNRAE